MSIITNEYDYFNVFSIIDSITYLFNTFSLFQYFVRVMAARLFKLFAFCKQTINAKLKNSQLFEQTGKVCLFPRGNITVSVIMALMLFSVIHRTKFKGLIMPSYLQIILFILQCGTFLRAE